MLYRAIRIFRIVFSLAFMAMVVAAAFLPSAHAQRLAHFLAHMEIVPALLTAGGLWVSAWAVITLLFGRIYCSSICPLGTLQDVVSRLASRRLTGPLDRYRYRHDRPMLRVLMLIVFVECLTFGATAWIHYMDPYTEFTRMVRFWLLGNAGALIGAAVTAVLTVAMAWRGGRLLCNSLCPVGAALGAQTSVSLTRIDINPDLCVHCGACERTCKGQCIRSDVSIVDNSRCVSCFDCTAVCPNGAITWRTGRHRLQWPLLQRTSAATPSALVAPNPQQKMKQPSSPAQ